MRASILLITVALWAAAAQVPADQTVNVGPGTSFTPSSITVVPGEKVTWNWLGSPHSSTSDATSGPEVWDSGLLSTGATFSHTFSTPGTYRYYCVLHGAPGGIGMSGIVIVAAPTPTPTPTLPPATVTPAPSATPGGGAAAIPDLGAAGKFGLAIALAGIAVLLLVPARHR